MNRAANCANQRRRQRPPRTPGPTGITGGAPELSVSSAACGTLPQTHSTRAERCRMAVYTENPRISAYSRLHRIQQSRAPRTTCRHVRAKPRARHSAKRSARSASNPILQIIRTSFHCSFARQENRSPCHAGALGRAEQHLQVGHPTKASRCRPRADSCQWDPAICAASSLTISSSRPQHHWPRRNSTATPDGRPHLPACSTFFRPHRRGTRPDNTIPEPVPSSFFSSRRNFLGEANVSRC